MAKFLVNTFKVLLILIVITVGAMYLFLRASLPQLDGTISAPVSAATQVTRDQLGTAQITANSRLDASYALGYLHGQERFFQMDLLRRNSAGELSQLFGEVALNHDKKVRAHQFRKRAQKYLSNLKPEHREILQRYTAGVNDGLTALSSAPFEYTLLGVDSAPWVAADSLLVLYSMYMDLQFEYGDRELTLGALSQLLPEDVYNFLTPRGSRWDAAIDGTQYQPSAVPATGFGQLKSTQELQQAAVFNLFPDPEQGEKGSNNWAVSGAVSATGSAIVADDMHLGIRVPNIWYRASLRIKDQQGEVKLDGVTLPGTPALVAGSNHKIAWGFTNSYGDWNDLILIQTSADGAQYLTPDGYEDFVEDIEVINIKGAEAKEHKVRNTRWGPVIGKNQNGQWLAMKWVAHDPQGINFNLLDLELAEDAEQAVNIAHTMGIPAQNIVLGDKQGNIAWTIAGAIPVKFGLSNSSNSGWAIPQDWSQGNMGWRGYLDSANYPKVINPQENRLWTGNSRVVGGQMYELIGNGGYALGARSQQIRDGLFALERFDEQDLLDIQNDDRAIFLTRWQQLLVNEVLTDEFVAEQKLAELQNYIANWQARAAIDDQGYLFVRQFRLNLQRALFKPLNEALKQSAPPELKLSTSTLRSQLETPTWQMVTEKPEQLLPNGYDSWHQLMQTATLDTHKQLIEKYGSIEAATWGAHNTSKIQHPLSKAVPALSWLLDMEQQPIRGDTYMPRVQGRDFGSSQRMVISPGHEQSAIFHMPSTQSSHPLSPFYGLGHQDWVKGIASPLLPGDVKHKLEFLPK